MTGKRISMLVGDYVEDYEVMVPFQALQMVGISFMPSVPIRLRGKRFGLRFMILKGWKQGLNFYLKFLKLTHFLRYNKVMSKFRLTESAKIAEYTISIVFC